jgi:predicted transcriptional regulator
MSTKKEVIDLVEGLPEEATLEDIQYHLYVLQKVRKGLKDVEEGRVLSQEDMQKRFEKWIVS